MKKENFRDKIRQELDNHNIESQIGTYSLHLEPAYSNMKKIGDLKNSESLFKNALTLPLHNQLTQEQQEKICKIVKNSLNP